MKKTLGWLACWALILFSALMVKAQGLAINGAGATFPYPVYSQWAHKYHELTRVKINYQSIGSGGGIAQIKARTVDFGASDEPLSPEDLEKSGLLQFPTVVGGVVPIINVEGVGSGQLKLDGETLANIFLGKISQWNDPAIQKLNPDLKLPAQAITVAHRTDGSGTTFIFTSYLCQVSPEWKAKAGAGKVVKWPAPGSIGGKGNEGVAGQVRAVKGAIGYVEYAYALQNRIPYVQLKNPAGKFVTPGVDSFEAAAAHADWQKAPKGFGLMLLNQPGEQSWPIVGATWILVHKEQKDPGKGREVLKFFDWAYKQGGDLAKGLHYVALPSKVVPLIQETWKEVKSQGKALWP